MNEEDTQYAKKKLLIDLINCEAAQIESERKRPGWSSWAFLGALATLTWLLIKQAPYKNIDWLQIGLVYLTIVLTVDFAKGLPLLFSRQHNNPLKEPRFRYGLGGGSANFTHFVYLLHTLLQLFIAICLFRIIPLISEISTLVLLGFYTIVFILAMRLGYRDIPQPRRPLGRKGTHIAAIIMLFYFVSALGCWIALINNINTYDSQNIKVAVILALISYVLILLGDLEAGSPILPSLISIRRDLILDKIEIGQATRQIDIALSGLKVEDILQEYVGKLLDCFEMINHHFKQLMQIGEAIENLESELKTTLDKEKINSLNRAIEALESERTKYSGNAASLKDRFTEAWNNYKTKAGQLIKADRRAELAINEVSKKVEMAREETLVLFKTYERNMLRRIAELKAGLTAPGIKS
ncbi:MAG: hypothetical protein ABFD52_05210 [Acidobacteriota bacterium]